MAKPDNDQMQATVAEVRRVYIEERRLFYLRSRGSEDNYHPPHAQMKVWDGGRDHRGVVHKSAWRAIVQYALRNKVDPAHLVRAAFRVCEGNIPPMPTHIGTEASLRALNCVREEQPEALRLQYEGYQREASQAFTTKKNHRPKEAETVLWKEIICAGDRSFGPLFRYCLSNNLGLEDFAAYYRSRAILEYVRAPNEHNELMGQYIPHDFREEAERVRKLISRG